jgi:arabinogalactan endo-1,4-beta-galactosidase
MAAPQYQLHKQRVQKWWSSISRQYRAVLHLAQTDKKDIERLRDVRNTLYQIKHAYDVFEDSAYPPEADNIRRHMLAAMVNLIACLQHAYHDNYHERDVLFGIMQVDMHMLETSLIEQDIPPFS